MSFYDSEDAPMESRIKIFRRQFKELDKLNDQKIEHLIRIYDTNLD